MSLKPELHIENLPDDEIYMRMFYKPSHYAIPILKDKDHRINQLNIENAVMKLKLALIEDIINVELKKDEK